MSAALLDIPFEIVICLTAILGLSALMSGLSGFGFSAIGASVLWILPATEAVPLLMALSLANQLMSIGQLRADLRPLNEWWPDGPAPYLVGGVIGVPLGLAVLKALPTAELMLVFGLFLVLYASYSLARAHRAGSAIASPWWASALVGLIGGVIGGFTAFPGAAVVVWTGLLHFPKREARGIVQPYILGLQIISLVMIAIAYPRTFSPQFAALFAIMLVIVLPGTLLGVHLYRSLSDVNFRRIAFILLGLSGGGLLIKALSSSHLAALFVVASHT